MIDKYRQNPQKLTELTLVKFDEIIFDSASANKLRAERLAEANTPSACEIRLHLIERFDVDFLSTLKATPKTDIEKLTLKEWTTKHKEIAIWK